MGKLNVMSVEMSTVPVYINNRSLNSFEFSKLRVMPTKCLMKCHVLSCSNSLPLVCYKSQNRLCCIKSVLNDNNGNKGNQLGKKDIGFLRKGFKLRLQPRLRLLGSKLKRVSVKAMLNDIGAYLRKNMRKVTLSGVITVVLGLCYLFLKLTAMSTPKVVPYSDLVTSIQSGSVMKVLFEEGSRRIYYNTGTFGVEDMKILEDKKLEISDNDENIVKSDLVKNSQITSPNVMRKSTKTKSSVPEWQFSTRKIDHDESYLLGLMREKGITYSSSPQSVLMSMRNTLITILSLWIPLTPLMWILYRQLSAANSPAKKRRPSNQVVNFEDVEGVDTAKVELMEVVLGSKGEDFHTAKTILNYVLELTKFDSYYDVRDRARVLRKLLSCYLSSSGLEEEASQKTENYELQILLAEHLFGETITSSTEMVNNRFYLPGFLSQIVLHAAPGYEPLPEPCSLTESDMVEVVEGHTQADSYEVDNSDLDSGSLNEEGSYDSEESVTDSTGTDYTNESAASEVENNTDPLINLSDVGKSQKDVKASEQNELGELMSKGALESWLDENPSSSQNIPGIDNERMSSARISIGDISRRVKQKTYMLLDPTYGNGLKVVYAYSSKASTISPSFVSVDMSFENCSSEPLSKLYLSDEDSALNSESSDQLSPPDERRGDE